jgi:hypothetical protein
MSFIVLISWSNLYPFSSSADIWAGAFPSDPYGNDNSLFNSACSAGIIENRFSDNIVNQGVTTCSPFAYLTNIV